MSSDKQTLGFQTEIRQLLDLMIHALYSNHEIFLRELISNASDACDKLRFEAIDDDALYAGDPDLRIRIAIDRAARSITISDNGIGMSRDEAVSNLGTIARSGTKDFFSRLTGDRKADSNLIGQFGVGFYSSFIVAKKVVVESRRAGLPDDDGVRWTSEGTGEFTVETIGRAQRGTDVTLYLRDNVTDAGDGEPERDYDALLDPDRVRTIVRNYSDHISMPIQMLGTKWDADAKEMVSTGEWETVNQARALWLRPRSELTDHDYQEFYRHLSGDYEEPLAWTHNRVEGRTEYTMLLYVPRRAPYDLWDRNHREGLRLYVRRVFIMSDAEQLLPAYLRFVRGVVDSSDLPLNVSREILQQSRDVRAIRDGCTRRVLGLLEELARDRPADYVTFWKQFGPVLKEGIGEDHGNQARIASLLRFPSTMPSPAAATTGTGATNDAAGAAPAGQASGSDDAAAAGGSSDAATAGDAASTTDAATGTGADAAADDGAATADAGVSLAQYKERMKPGQKAIYYVTGDTEAGARNSPHLEVFRKKGVEVLVMTDRVDEWMLSFLREFDGTPLESVSRGSLDLGELQDETERRHAEEVSAEFKPLAERIAQSLGDRVREVRVTDRLTDSASCLVSADGDISGTLERLLKQAGQPAPERRPILEINPDHPLVQRLQHGLQQQPGERLDTWSALLYDQAVLAEGGTLADPATFVREMNRLLVELSA